MPSPRNDRRTKTSNDWGKPDETFPWADQLTPTVVETKTVRQDAVQPQFGDLHPNTVKYPNAYLVDRISEPGENSDQNLTLTYETLPGSWLYDWSIAEDSEVISIQRRHKLRSNITPGEAAGGGFLIKTTGQSITDLVSWEIIESRPLPGNILTDYGTEPETQALITTTIQIVANPVSAPSPSPGQLIHVEHIDFYNSRVITQTRSTPSGWTEQRNSAFSFPALIDLSTYIYTDDCGPISNRRAGFSCNVKLTVDITFGSYVDFTGLQLIPSTLDLGKYVQFQGVLVNAGFFVFSGSCSLTVSWGDSSPSYSAYLALIGTPQLIGGSSTKTKWGDFRTERLSVTMI